MGTRPAVVTDQRVLWDSRGLLLEIRVPTDASPTLARAVTPTVTVEFGSDTPLVEMLAVGHGHTQASSRLINTTLGRDLRYSAHRELEIGELHRLDLVLATAGDPQLTVTVKFESYAGSAVVRSSVLIENTGSAALTLQSVTSWSSAFGAPGGSRADFSSWALTSGVSDWLAEGRWQTRDLRGPEFPVIAQQLTGREPRSSRSVTSRGTWSTGADLPVAALVSEDLGIAWLWQLEHNGAWRWEVGENSADGYLALSGPTEIDHDWRATLAPGETFETVTVAVVLSAELDAALGELTSYRRRDRRPHVDNEALPVVFNDYMNTLNGDPSTEKLLPLIDAAASVGAEVFCIDAGWYDDGGDWWDSVGEWQPSTVRFPGGFRAVIDHITTSGMIPGLWLEPEVVGVRSPAAARLPHDAFFQRDGVRVIEHDRYHLDFRHPAAIAHVDEVVDRLVNDFGIGFFKLDYNIDPGLGTDVASASLGAGLLDHNRAHLAWLDGVATRHPELILENCASGAMRTDWAMLSRMQMQSTSDQQDFLKYPPIAASAPMSMLPEQAASWAYPQPTMSDEQIAFCLVTGLLGRYYVSGYLNLMSETQLELVREAITTAKELRTDIAESVPVWPLGLPGWDDEWVAIALSTERSQHVTVWKRTTTPASAALHFPNLVGVDVTVRTTFPTSLPEWDMTWDPTSGTLTIFAPTASEAARTIELVAVTPTPTSEHHQRPS